MWSCSVFFFCGLAKHSAENGAGLQKQSCCVLITADSELGNVSFP